MAYIPSSGSVVAFQPDATKLTADVSVVSMVPHSVSGVGTFNTNNVGNGSIVTVGQGSIAVAIVSGSVAVSVTPTANQSVSGTVQAELLSTNASIITVGGGTTGNSSVMLTPGTNTIGSVATLQGTNPWIVQLTSGSVITSGGNSSVQVVGQIPPTSVSGVGTFNINPVGNGSVLTVGNVASGSADVGAPIKVGGVYNLTQPTLADGQRGDTQLTTRGAIKTTLFANDSSTTISALADNADAVAVSATTNKLGIVNKGFVFNGSSWDRQTQYREDVAANSVAGVALVFRRTDNASIMGIVSPNNPLPVTGTITNNQNPASVQLLGSTNVIGSVATLQGTNPWVIGNSSVMLVPGTNVIGSVAVLQGTNPFTVQTTGSVIAFVMGSVAAVGNTSVMLTAGTNVIGSVATLQGTNPWVIGNSSVLLLPGLNVIGSVAVLQGTSPWITTTQASSIVGTYAEDAASADGDKGIFVLAIRNDTVASLVSADKDYSGFATDSAGRQIVKPFAGNEASIFGHSSTVNAGDVASVLLIAAAGAGLKNYITDYQISNSGSVSTIVTLTEGGGSVLARTIAPAGGGSNMPGMTWPVSNVVPNQPINLVTGTASSVLYISFRGFKAP